MFENITDLVSGEEHKQDLIDHVKAVFRWII